MLLNFHKQAFPAISSPGVRKMQQTRLRKKEDTLPPCPEAVMSALARRTSRPPPGHKPRLKPFEEMVEDFVRGVAEKGNISHQK
jgi:hypothetical protein